MSNEWMHYVNRSESVNDMGIMGISRTDDLLLPRETRVV